MEDAAKDPIESKTDPNVEGSPTSAEPKPAQELEEAQENDGQPDQAPTEEQIETEAIEDPAEGEAEESVESEEEATEELPDLIAMDTEDLVGLAARSLKERPISDLRSLMEGIQLVVQERFEAVYEENKRLFLEQGGNEIDFRFHNPLRDSFLKTYREYKSKRRSYYQLLEKELQVNLQRKKALIEELKQLLQKEESLSESFKELKSIRERWNETGPVPKTESDNIWKTWHFHLDNFYDYVRINDDLRDLDFKKNRAAKEQLCLEAEGLFDLEHIGQALGKLQDLHKQWKRIGPVEPDFREPLWERFTAATQKMHERREVHRKELAERDEERIEGKKAVLEQMEAFSTEGMERHDQWKRATEELEGLFDAFKKLGRVNHPENDELWKRSKDAYRHFQQKKNEHYKEVKKDLKANLEAKEKLVARARELQDSDQWRDTSNELKKLQQDWKAIGVTQKKEGDRVWSEFRSACDHFFQRMKEDRKAYKAKQKDLAAQKMAAVEELKALVGDEKKLSKKTLLDAAKKYRSLGRLGRDFQKTEDLFEETLQQGFDKLKMDRMEASKVQFEQKLESLNAQGDQRGIERERQQLRRLLDEAQKEVQQLENNIQFFRSGKGTNPLIKQVENRIGREKEKVESLRAQLRSLNKATQEKG